MTVENIRKTIEKYQQQDLKLFVTSSFQTHSIPLLHILSEIDRSIPVMFLHTGYLFPETLKFRDEVTELLGLNLINIFPGTTKMNQKDCDGNLLFTSDPDHCCYLNKTLPMEPVLAANDVWINGIRADQNANRKAMKTEQKAAFDCMRFHPVLDWSNKMIWDYAKKYKLPKHPLENSGYLSIGCEPCTMKIDLANNRDGRWFGLNKTECGLHTDLAEG